MLCETCHNEFPSRCIPPYDLALYHYEWWRYQDPDNQHGPWNVSHKETAKFYHVDLENCIKPWHPHFSDNAVFILDDIKAKLQPVHQTFLGMHLKISTLEWLYEKYLFWKVQNIFRMHIWKISSLLPVTMFKKLLNVLTFICTLVRVNPQVYQHLVNPWTRVVIFTNSYSHVAKF